MGKQNLKTVIIRIFVLLLLTNHSAFCQSDRSQKTNEQTFSERVFLGGSLGFSIGTYSSLIDISPIIGYAVTDDLIAGIGFTYKYYKYKDYYFNFVDDYYTDYKLNIFGFSVWSRYFLTKTEIPIIENAFIHAEVEPLSFTNQYRFNPNGDYFDPFYNTLSKDSETINLTGIFLGGGIRQLIGGRSYMYLEVVWNLNEEFYSPYSNPRIRLGFAAGF